MFKIKCYYDGLWRTIPIHFFNNFSINFISITVTKDITNNLYINFISSFIIYYLVYIYIYIFFSLFLFNCNIRMTVTHKMTNFIRNGEVVFFLRGVHSSEHYSRTCLQIFNLLLFTFFFYYFDSEIEVYISLYF